MTKYEIGILVVGGLTGWWVISYLFDKRGGTPTANDAPPAVPAHDALPGTAPADGDPEPSSEQSSGRSPPAGSSGAPGLSVLELQDRWPEVLDVDRGATTDEIEAAYARRRAAIDRIRFSERPSAEREAAARDLRTLDAAYEFVRSARG
jgi:hypothetical protein